MELKIITDSSCDLPSDWLAEQPVILLPIGIRVGDKVMQDDRNSAQALEFYQKDLAHKGVVAESVPPSQAQIEQFLLETAALQTDHALGVTVTSTRSLIFEHFLQASHAILKQVKPARDAAGRSGHFALRVLDSGNMFAGQGALVAEAVRCIRGGGDAKTVKSCVEAMIPKTWAYLIPADLYYVRARAKKKGDNSVGIVKYALGTALNIRPILRCNLGETQSVASARGGFESGAEMLISAITTAVQQRSVGGSIVVSYGGTVEAIAQLPGFAALEAAARAASVDMICSTMSMTAGVNVGAGGLSIGVIADEAPL